MKFLTTFLVFFLLSGCSVTGLQLKENPSEIYEYTVKENYKKVFRRIVQASKQCYESGEQRIEAYIFDDNETAEITLAIIYGGAIRALYVIDIKSIGESATEVTGYYPYSLTNAWGLGVEDSKEWALGNLDVCRYKNP